MGIEPTSSAWKAEVLPLNYTRFPNKPCSWHPCRRIVDPLNTGPAIHGGSLSPLRMSCGTFGRAKPIELHPLSYHPVFDLPPALWAIPIHAADLGSINIARAQKS